MTTKLTIVCASIVGLLLVTAGKAEAQIVAITNTGFVAGPPPKADPQGTYSVPATGSYRVKVDYGTVNNGVFTPDNTIGLGFTTLTLAPGNGAWGPVGPETLKNPLPANSTVRARIQQYSQFAKVWNDVTGAGAVAFQPLQ